MRVFSEMNTREHWAAKQRRAKAQRTAITLALAHRMRPYVGQPVTVTLTRIAARPFDEGDNLPASFKHVRDAIAALLQTHDGPLSPVTWTYAQERSTRPKEYAIRIALTPPEGTP